MRASKTANKHAADDAKLLGKHLVDVPSDALAGFGLPPELLDALAEYRRHKGHKEARRLMQNVAALMRDLDVVAVAARLQAWREEVGRVPARLEQVKRWRDALVDGDDQVMEEVLAAAPLLDRGQLERLATNARWEREHQRPPRDFRVLFGLIRDAVLAADAAAGSTPPAPEG